MPEPRTDIDGFTLIEVLVALAVVALGLMAALGQVNQALVGATRLKDKTLAHWIALDRMTEMRLLGEFPPEGTRSDEIEMGGVSWRYTIRVDKTELQALRRVEISVGFGDEPDSVVTSLTGFLGQVTPAPPDAISQADWFCPEPGGPGP